MAVSRPRRLDLSSASLYDRMATPALHDVPTRAELEAVEAKHPELIVSDGSNVLAALPWMTSHLAYAFESDRAFIDRFPGMLETLLPRARSVGAVHVRFRLSHGPSRPYVEPVLRNAWFSPTRDWWEFTLERGELASPGPLPRGVKMRPRTVSDIDACARIDQECFPDTPMLREDFARAIASGEDGLMAESGGEVVGFAAFSERDTGHGWIGVIAVTEAARGKGIGAALTARAAKALFTKGCSSVGLTTNDDNARAIRTYRGLGFRQTRAGRDYTRPTDPKAIERIKKGNEGSIIRFGGWR